MIGRVIYALLLVLMAFVAFVLNNVPTWTDNSEYLKWIPGFKGCATAHGDKSSSPTPTVVSLGLPTLPSLTIPEQLCYGTMSVYRVCFALSIFHLALALSMIGVKSTKDMRHQLQHSWWSIKLLLLAGLTVASFFIPNVVFGPFAWVALIGAGFFVLIQVVLLVDFAHSINEKLLGWYQDTGSRFWVVILVGMTAVLYLASISGSVVMYWFFSENSTTCWYNPMFVTFNIMLCFGFSVFSIYPRFQEANPRIGLLQSAVVTGYCSFLIWSALSSEPQSMGCNNFPLYVSDNDSSSGGGFSMITGVLLTFVALVYSAFRISGSSDEMGVVHLR